MTKLITPEVLHNIAALYGWRVTNKYGDQFSFQYPRLLVFFGAEFARDDDLASILLPIDRGEQIIVDVLKFRNENGFNPQIDMDDNRAWIVYE